MPPPPTGEGKSPHMASEPRSDPALPAPLPSFLLLPNHVPSSVRFDCCHHTACSYRAVSVPLLMLVAPCPRVPFLPSASQRTPIHPSKPWPDVASSQKPLLAISNRTCLPPTASPHSSASLDTLPHNCPAPQFHDEPLGDRDCSCFICLPPKPSRGPDMWEGSQ